jgi:hypothetical protein
LYRTTKILEKADGKLKIHNEYGMKRKVR